ncbi:hypothetical protein EDC38_3145 [Marinimicrobium koreense]|uniref:Uncharacterized protein n=1 Tax=Marinimicrobium koreense TaxID=306545 RepID=A0A3N1NRX0_9GAMM|nr:hypothetical protein EDC38_3145 [Marinimicrobium koreense]
MEQEEPEYLYSLIQTSLHITGLYVPSSSTAHLIGPSSLVAFNILNTVRVI